MSVIYRHLVDDAGFTPEQAKAALGPWDIRDITDRGLKVGEVMLLNNEVHFALIESYRNRLGRVQLLRNTLTKLLAEKKYLVTKLAHNDKSKSLIEAFGFTKVKVDDEYEYFWMNEEDPIRVLKREKHDRD